MAIQSQALLSIYCQQFENATIRLYICMGNPRNSNLKTEQTSTNSVMNVHNGNTNISWNFVCLVYCEIFVSVSIVPDMC